MTIVFCVIMTMLFLLGILFLCINEIMASSIIFAFSLLATDYFSNIGDVNLFTTIFSYGVYLLGFILFSIVLLFIWGYFSDKINRKKIKRDYSLSSLSFMAMGGIISILMIIFIGVLGGASTFAFVGGFIIVFPLILIILSILQGETE